jgi:hypothetical protein
MNDNTELLLRAHRVLVKLKNALIERLVNEGLPITVSEEELIKECNALIQLTKEEVINGPKDHR